MKCFLLLIVMISPATDYPVGRVVSSDHLYFVENGFVWTGAKFGWLLPFDVPITHDNGQVEIVKVYKMPPEPYSRSRKIPPEK